MNPNFFFKGDISNLSNRLLSVTDFLSLVKRQWYSLILIKKQQQQPSYKTILTLQKCSCTIWKLLWFHYSNSFLTSSQLCFFSSMQRSAMHSRICRNVDNLSALSLTSLTNYQLHKWYAILQHELILQSSLLYPDNN